MIAINIALFPVRVALAVACVVVIIAAAPVLVLLRVERVDEGP